MKINKLWPICSLMMAFALNASAAEPAGYYASLNGKSGADLKTAIYELVRNFNQKEYSKLPTYFMQTDVRTEGNDTYWWDMYSNIPYRTPSFSGMNREHSFPKSWWNTPTVSVESVPAYVDLNHLYPAEAAPNQAKSNFPLGEVDPRYYNSKETYNNGMVMVGYPASGIGGGASKVFEPSDEYKGDFARTYFYMVTCYQNLTWNSSYDWMLQDGPYPTLKKWAIDMLLDWHHADEVSQKEIDRNDAVYRIQNNRNPFIDHPELVDYIWGDLFGQIYNGSSVGTGNAELFTPVQDMSLDFGQVAIGSTIVNQLLFKGENLSANLNLRIYTGNNDMFSIPSSSLSYSLVNTTAGTMLNITYKPTSLGTHTSRLLISGGGLSGSRGVELRGECLPVPTLGACTATAPTDITEDTYVANWTYPSTDVVDYWVINRTIYSGSTIKDEIVLGQEPGTLIDGFRDSDKESYTVQSVRLGYMSTPSNIQFVEHAGVTGVRVDEPLLVRGFNGFMHFLCSAPQTNARVYDMTGRTVMTIETIDDGLEVEIGAGIYVVTTDQCARPIKVIVR